MILPDVNVLVYAFIEEAPGHERYQEWLESLVNGQEQYALSELVLSSFLRVVTHPRVQVHPASIDDAIGFVEEIRGRPTCTVVHPGPRHWSLFVDLCLAAGAKGNLVPDAYLAALAIETGAEWITTDRDFARFPGLRWRLPFD